MYQSELWFTLLWLIICVLFALIGYMVACVFEKHTVALHFLKFTSVGSVVSISYAGLLVFAESLTWLVAHGYVHS